VAREKCELLPDTQQRPNHDRPADLQVYVASPDACEGAGTDGGAAPRDVTVALYLTETPERSPVLLASALAAGHAATLAVSRKIPAFLSREADIQMLLRINDDAPWERSYQLRPFAVDIFDATELARPPFFSSPRGNAASTPPQESARVSSWPSGPSALRCRPLTRARSGKAIVSLLLQLPESTGNSSVELFISS
jgi:hypothetical protein